MEKLQLNGVFAVPPLARRNDVNRTLDFAQNELIVKHVHEGGITRLIYGGNAFLYHVSLREYEVLLEWLSGLSDDLWIIPSAGPSFGRALDHAEVLRKFRFSAVMMLPCSDPRDATGLEQGYREISDACESKLILYLKEENVFGADKEAGLDVVARLVDDGICTGIKYAVVRPDPKQDAYLEALLARVDRKYVISGIGERPAIVHLRDWKLAGFTTGSGCVAPGLSQEIFEACSRGDFDTASAIRERFLAMEDLRDEWGPARVLHHAVELAGIATTGPIAPYVSGLTTKQLNEVGAVAKTLLSESS
jgi:dihydrodipicolinate synthase/N-acetylneuraminate lyase